jgi:VCBS repeat-containing protein
MPANSDVRVLSFTGTDPSTTDATVVHYLLTFSAPVTGVDAGDFSLITSGVTGASFASVTPVSGSNGAQYAIAVNTGTHDGTIALHLSVAGIQDTLGQALAAVTFETLKIYAVGPNPMSAAAGDLNGDGKPDLVVSNFGVPFPSVSVLLGNGDGTFQNDVTYLAGTHPNSVAIGDFSGDGKPDLAVADNTTTGAVSVLLGNGDGTFQPHASYAAGDSPRSVAIGDFNGDGTPDLAVANAGLTSTMVSVLLGNGNGTFQPQTTYAAGVQPFSIATGDLDGDGKLDLATADLGSGTGTTAVSVLLGNGDGTFRAHTDYATTGTPRSIAIGDLNGDGRSDLVTANRDTDTVSVFLGNGDGTFQPQTTFVAGPEPLAIAIADFNGDGRPDLVTSNFGSSTENPTAGVLLGNGDGTFQTETHYTTGASPAFVLAADLNGDGRPDVVTTNQESGSVSVILNTTQTLPDPTYTIDKPNVAPTAANGSASGAEDTVITGTLAATDADGDSLTFSRVTQAAHGTVTVNDNGSFSYAPNANYNGPDNFAFKANDGLLDSNTATENLTVSAVNDAPVAVNGSASGDENTVVNGTLVATDIDSASLTFSRVAQGAHGSVTVNANGSFSYTPNANYTGADSFTFKANDGSLDSNVATVGLTIADNNPVGDNSLAPPHLPLGTASSASTGSQTGSAALSSGEAAGALAQLIPSDFHLF